MHAIQYVLLMKMWMSFCTSANIHGDYCLQTAFQFIHSIYKCNFQSKLARSYFSKEYICKRKCSMTMNGLDWEWNLLKRVNLTINDSTHIYSLCTWTKQQWERSLVIKCSSWKHDEYYMQEDILCQRQNALCGRIGSTCICQCNPGYFMFNGQCLAEVSFGGFCEWNEQCGDSGECTHEKCICRVGYIFIESRCYKKNLVLNQSCTYDIQCSGSPYAACLGNRCGCIEGYTAKNISTCMKQKASYGGVCTRDDHCTDSTVCRNKRCTCKDGSIFHDNECIETVPLEKSCTYDIQCSGSPYAACLRDRCYCIEGYTAESTSTCIKQKASYGGVCTKDDQCTDSTECRNKRCTCKDGSIYIDNDNKCLETVPLNQTCTDDKQCSETPYASCVDGKCDCIAGYTARNLSECVLFSDVCDHQDILEQKDVSGNNLTTTLGVLFGGFVFGVLITAGIVFVMYRRFQSSLRKRTEPSVAFTDAVYSLPKPADSGNNGTSRAKIKRNFVNVAEKESPVYSNVPQKHSRQLTNEDVYNHLNEEEEQNDDDNYDHACAATGNTGDLNLYSYVQRDYQVQNEHQQADINDYSTMKV